MIKRVADWSGSSGGWVVSETGRTIIGIMGGSICDARTAEKAHDLGRRLAQAGYVVLCGGGTGVMEAVSRGAREGGGLVVGIMPGSDARQSPPNPYVDIPIFTGISHARNLVNVLSAAVVVAIGGAHGTLSEIALAIKAGKPVVLLDSWEFRLPGERPSPLVHRVTSPEEAAQAVDRLLG